MEAKTTQLQVRVSPAEKAALKRLAAASGLSVSAYVLSRALPASGDALNRRIRALDQSGDLEEPLGDLVAWLSDLDDVEYEQAVGHVDLSGLTPLQQNCAAGAVERESSARDRAAPGWTAEVPPLDRPWFSRGLRSLRPHLMRVSAPAFKRRNVFQPLPGDPRR